MRRHWLQGIAAASIVFIAAIGCLQAAALSTITVLPHALVIGPKILLSDLLTREGRDILKSRSPETTIVSISPLPGKSRIVDTRTVRAKLMELGVTPDRYLLQMPQQIRVERQAQIIAADQIEDFVRNDFLSQLPWSDARLVEMTIPEGVILPVGEVEMTVQPPARTDFARPFYLSIEFRVDGQTVKRAYYRTVLSVAATVAVAARELTASGEVSSTDIRWERKALKTTLRTLVVEESFFVGRRPRIGIAAGEILTQDMFRVVPLITRGDKVTLVFDDGRIRVSTQGESLSNGSKGDRIRVMNADSRAELFAEVIDAGTVRIVN
jgi:flagella basal body P-ring formation protein FlgA